MITAADAIAIYGAALATILATLQYAQWRRSQELLVVTHSKEFTEPGDHPEIMIANRSAIPIYLSFIGIGYFFRKYLTPWKLSYQEINALKAVEGDRLSGKGAEGLLGPGAYMEAYFARGDFRELCKPTGRSGFSSRLCIWIDHSGSDKPFCKTIRRHS